MVDFGRLNENLIHYFGGISIIFPGDPAQLLPVFGVPLYDDRRKMVFRSLFHLHQKKQKKTFRFNLNDLNT
jgi:hypothetical protein